LQRREDPLPHAGRAPAVEAARHRPDRAVAPRQIAPGRAGAQHPQDAVQDAPMGLIRPPRAGLLRRQVRLQAPPLRLRQITSSHPADVGSHTCNGTGLQKRPSLNAPCRGVKDTAPPADAAGYEGHASGVEGHLTRNHHRYPPTGAPALRAPHDGAGVWRGCADRLPSDEHDHPLCHFRG
jgi:hypothetical protein